MGGIMRGCLVEWLEVGGLMGCDVSDVGEAGNGL